MRYEENILCHKNGHKYIYKKKINGKWRYYYYVGKENYTLNGNHSTGLGEYSKLDDVMGRDELDRFRISYQNAKDANAYRRSIRGFVDYDTYSEAETKSKNLDKVANKNYWEFRKTPLGAIYHAHETINKGKQAIGRWLSKTADSLINSPTDLALSYKYKGGKHVWK